MNSLLEQYLVIDIDGAFGYTDQGKQYCQSVHFGESRFKEAERQNSKPVVAIRNNRRRDFSIFRKSWN